MATQVKAKKSAGTKSSHPEIEGKKAVSSRNPERFSKGQVRLSVEDKKRKSSVSIKSRKSSAAERKSEVPDRKSGESERKSGESERKSLLAERKSGVTERKSVRLSHDESKGKGKENLQQGSTTDVEDGEPLDPEKSKEKAKVLKSFLENKYKVEFPRVEGDLERSDTERPLTEKEILARNGVDMDLTKEEQVHLIQLYEKLEDGLAQAEEFFRSIGIEWSSEHQMFKVKPKKFMPAMTMIAFGPDYDDVIVCKDDEETGETQACVLSKENRDCPKDVTSVNLNVYKDGFQAEEDEFYAYSSDSIKDFFQKNIGSYIIMKPNDAMPQTVLIRVIDERSRSFDEVQKERAQGIPKQKNKPKKKKCKVKEQARKSGNVETQSAASEDEETESKPKYYSQPPNNKTATETVEIFERHKIIKRLEDMPIEEDGMGPSSWCWKNQRNPLSSEYVVPPNITTTTFDTDEVIVQDHQPAPTCPARQSQRPVPPLQAPAIIREEKSTSVTDSLLNAAPNRISKDEKPPQSAVVPTPNQANAATRQGNDNLVPVPVAVPAADQVLQRNQSETNINKINIFHGPVTVINLGETSDDSVRISPRPDNKLKVSMRRQAKNKPDGMVREEESQTSQEWNNFVKNEERTVKEARPSDSPVRFPPVRLDVLDPPWGNSDYPMKFETEYDSAYNQGATRWAEFFEDSARRKSVRKSVAGDETNTTYQHITLFGQPPPPQPEKKISVLLDLGGHTGKRETVEGIELNKKTSDTQITVALRDNNNGKKYLVNIYPEEQLKKIWSILKLNKIDIQNVTPELVLGDSEWHGNIANNVPPTEATKEAPTVNLKDKKSPLLPLTVEKDTISKTSGISGTTQEKDTLSKTSGITGTSQEKDNASGSDKSDEVSVDAGNPPSIQSEDS